MSGIGLLVSCIEYSGHGWLYSHDSYYTMSMIHRSMPCTMHAMSQRAMPIGSVTRYRTTVPPGSHHVPCLMRQDCDITIYVWQILEGSAPNMSDDHGISAQWHARRGRECRVPRVSPSAPSCIQAIRFSSFPIKGPRICNLFIYL